MDAILLILCHPNSKSFNHAVAAAVASALEQRGHSVLFHDLYAERFDPVLDFGELRRRFSFDDLIQRHYKDLEAADGIVFVHPEWWSQPPAMLKGWIDRVIGPGIGYEFEGEEFMPKEKIPLLTGKRALVLATTDAEPPTSGSQETPIGREPADTSKGGTVQRRTDDPLLALLWKETFAYCGIDDVTFRMLFAARSIEPAERREWLERSAELACELFS